MYKIYTSYFRHRKIKEWQHPSTDRPLLIPICRGLTRLDTNMYYTWYKELAPSEKLLFQYNKALTKTPSLKNWFTEKYLKELDLLRESNKLQNYIDQLQELVKYNDVFLLCYERSSEFCHRHILSWYLNEYYKLGIREY